MPSHEGEQTIIVDFDGTIAEDGHFPGIGEPILGVREALEELSEAGFKIVIFTCRLNKNDRDVSQMKNDIEEWLNENEITYDEIDEGYDGKPFGDFYIDNKGLNLGKEHNWDSIKDFILGGGQL